MADIAPGTLIDDRYRLQALIGSGGEARVYIARDEISHGDVAIRMPLRAGSQRNAITLPASWASGWVQLLGEGADPVYGVYQTFELLRGETLAATVATGPLARHACCMPWACLMATSTRTTFSPRAGAGNSLSSPSSASNRRPNAPRFSAAFIRWRRSNSMERPRVF
jgi:hypothetical protein